MKKALSAFEKTLVREEFLTSGYISIRAIREYRNRTKRGLFESKEAIEDYLVSLPAAEDAQRDYQNLIRMNRAIKQATQTVYSTFRDNTSYAHCVVQLLDEAMQEYLKGRRILKN
jgi:hypothetical protein